METALFIVIISQGLLNVILLNTVLKNQGFIVEKLNELNKEI